MVGRSAHKSNDDAHGWLDHIYVDWLAGLLVAVNLVASTRSSLAEWFRMVYNGKLHARFTQ